MKKIIIVFVSGVLYTSLISNYVNAQKATDISFVAPKIIKANSSEEGNKTTKGSTVDPVDKSAIKMMEANLKAAKANLRVTTHFSKNFKNASAVTWNTEEEFIVAKFAIGEKSSKVVYDKRGNWLYNITTFHEDQMPGDIRSLINEEYNGYTISMVQEINKGGITVYVVYLEDYNSYKQILVCNDELTVYKEFEKSK